MSEIVYVIKYDGLKLGEHTIDLATFGESLQGFSKVLACVGHFVATGQYNRRYSSLSVKVSTTAQLKEGSIELPIAISAYEGELFSGFAGAALTSVVTYVMGRRDKKEMELLAKALEQSMAQNKDTTDKLISTIDKMADGLVLANRQALSPIGTSCNSIYVMGQNREEFVSADVSLKEFFTRTQVQNIEAEREFVGIITELDRLTGACKITMDGDELEDRINGQITDPALTLSENIYVRAFSVGEKIRFRAKAQTNADGEVVKLFISDTVS